VPDVAGDPRCIGFDIETDTSIDGLDPSVAAVVSVALVGEGFEIVIDEPDEANLLRSLDATLATLPDAVLATWNGAGFDLPFLAHRAAWLGVELGLALDPSDAVTRWYGHQHLDGYRLYRADVGRTVDVSCGLKSIGRLVGMAPIEVDRERIHELTESELRSYVLSDADVTRRLVLRRWSTARRRLDHSVRQGVS